MMYPTTPKAQRGNTNARTERMQDLAGERNNPQGEAVTIGMAARLGTVALKARRVTAAPTAAEHNALVDDIAAIVATLNAMGAKFTGV